MTNSHKTVSKDAGALPESSATDKHPDNESQDQESEEPAFDTG